MERALQVSGDADCERRLGSFTSFGLSGRLVAAGVGLDGYLRVDDACFSARGRLARGSWRVLEAFFPQQSINGV
jgi:hypothetical protein